MRFSLHLFLQYLFKKLFSNIFRLYYQRHICIHLYIFIIVSLIAFFISSILPFGILHSWRFIVSNHPHRLVLRNQIIDKQKHEQIQALQWFKDILQHSNDYPHLFSNETHKSRFFDHLQVEKTTFNSFQKSQHTMYKLFDIPDQRSSKFLNNNNKNYIVISIIYTTKDIDYREGKFYIGQVLRHLLENFHHRFIITLCEDNHINNDLLSSAVKLIRQLVPVFIINNDMINNVSDSYEREKQVYLRCILANFQSFPNSDYVVLLEDDAEPIDHDFSTRLLTLIDYRLKKQWSPTIRQQPAFLKLYHPRWLLSYSSPSVYTIIQLFATSFLLTFFLHLCVHQFDKVIQRNNNKNISWQYHGTLFENRIHFSNKRISIIKKLIYFILTTLVLFLLNHSNVLWTWRSLHPSFYAIYPAPSCCTPSVLFFRQTYVQVIDYLTRTKCRSGYAIDTAFDDLPKNTSLQTLLVEPNLVHHIGLYSRLRHDYINPYLLD